MAGKSLLDDKMGSIGTPKAAAAKKNDGPKLVLALVLFVIAGAVVAWSMGLFESNTPKETISQEQQQAQQQQAQRTEQTIKSNKGTTGGTD